MKLHVVGRRGANTRNEALAAGRDTGENPRMRRALLFLALVAGVSACQISTKPLPLDVIVQVTTTTPAAGDTIGVVVTAQGKNLINMVVDYADGKTDQFSVGGARTAQVVFPHAFTAPGNYTIKATITDSDDGDLSATTSVVVH